MASRADLAKLGTSWPAPINEARLGRESSVAGIFGPMSDKSAKNPVDKYQPWPWRDPDRNDPNITYGAKSEHYQAKPSYYNILYCHPLFGHSLPWAEIKSELPPVNSIQGAQIPPDVRMTQRQTVSGAGLPQWQALGPGAKAIHAGHTIKTRATIREFAQPASISKHCQPTPPLPEPAFLSRTRAVHKSTNHLLRLPAHTVHRRQIEERAYGPRPRSGSSMVSTG